MASSTMDQHKVQDQPVTTAPADPDVIIVGAGPVGVYLSVRLASQGLTAIVLEASTSISSAPRAVTHMPIMFAEFKRAGIFDTLKEQSKAHSGGISFRRTVDQQLIERIPPIPGRPGPIVVPQKQFTETLIAQMGKLDKATLCMGTKVVGVEETAGGVEVEAEDVTTGEKKNFRAKWLVGADGGNSFVRRTLGIKYEGLDLPYKLVAADVVYPFQKYGFDGANFMLDEENFGNIAVTSELDDENWLWRVGCAFPDSMSDEEIMAALPKKFDAMFPGPRPLNYELKGAAPYKAAQLCVPSFRKGRTLLIGDAAHLANPYSGQLMSCGIFDAASLCHVLSAHIQRSAPESLIDAWAHDRLLKYKKVLDPLSQACLKAVSNKDAETIAQRHPFLKAFKAGPAGGPPPTLETDVQKLEGWIDPEGGISKEDERIELIWSKA